MLPPSPQAFTEAFWRGQQRRFALALHDDFIYFWEPDSAQFQGAPQEWVFVVDSQLCFSDERQITPHFLASELEWALANNRVGRRFQLADTLTIFLRESCYLEETSSVVFYLGTIRKWANFCWAAGFQRAASECIVQLEDDAVDEPSGWGFLGDILVEEQIPFSTGSPTKMHLARGTQSEMNIIADLIFQLSPEWVENAMSRPRCSGNVELRIILRLDKPARYICGYDHKDGGLCSVPHPYAELWSLWLSYFAPRPDIEFHREEIVNGRRLFSCSFIPHMYLDSMISLHDYLLRKSQHEQMELLLQLRDWLRDRVGLCDESIAELLA